MFQAFEWYVPADQQHWQRLARAAPALAALGVTTMWIPPACKAWDGASTGYDIYDPYDLGEFAQKGTVATKYGTKAELHALNAAADRARVRLLFDVLLNHLAGADYPERAVGIRVDPEDRTREVTGRPEDLGAWTGFAHAGRGGAYSDFRWDRDCFNGVDWNADTQEQAIWRLGGRPWAADADADKGNYDYLMFANVDHARPAVRRELFRWVGWLGGQLRLGGVRLDASKHMSKAFQRALVAHLRAGVGRDWLVVAEYWHLDAGFLAEALVDDAFGGHVLLYDVPLVHRLRALSWTPAAQGLDLRTVFAGSLAAVRPRHAVTFVVNHDTQEGQTSECLVAPWFVPLAYALLLLHVQAGIPCVFYGDLYGSFGPMRAKGRGAGTFDLPFYAPVLLPRLMLARTRYAYGDCSEYFVSPLCVGFTRHGHPGRSGGAGCAVLLCAADAPDRLRMFVGRHHAGETWTDILGGVQGKVVIDPSGHGMFGVNARSTAVWVSESADGRAELDAFVFDHDIYGQHGK
ncbi:alpha-amylase [Xylariomycetidae sp. FL0641]|nr:alpha-amylase [Xylariomycetidae sp. FL0641]